MTDYTGNTPYPHVYDGRIVNARKGDGFLLKTTFDPSTGVNLTEEDVTRLNTVLGHSGELINGVLLDGVFLEMEGKTEPNVFWRRISAEEDGKPIDLQHFDELIFNVYGLNSNAETFPVKTVTSGSVLL